MSVRDGHYVLDPRCREYVDLDRDGEPAPCPKCARRRRVNRATVSRPRSLRPVSGLHPDDKCRAFSTATIPTPHVWSGRTLGFETRYTCVFCHETHSAESEPMRRVLGRIRAFAAEMNRIGAFE